MLAFPDNLFKRLFSISDLSRKGNDLEKSRAPHISPPQPVKRDVYSQNGAQHRPADLDLSSQHLDDDDDPKTEESMKRYRLLPIFAGIMIPFSIMLSIPSLTGHWYIRTGDNSTIVETRANPPLLDAGMGLSMGCGILASACLVIRFAERHIKLMTFLCIVFLTLHDLINICAVTVFGVEHRFDDGFTYGQSFWFTVCSTIVSTVTNITLFTDYYQTKDFDHSGSGLTHKQRSLVIIVIILLCYVSIGSLILAVMLKMSFIDALYLSVVTIETIGFGDLHPDSTGTRVFACFYIAGGILNLALAVALSREALLESAAVGFRSRIRAAEARQRERHIRTRWKAAVRWRLRAEGQPMWLDDLDEERRGRVGRRRHRHWYSSIRRMWRKLLDEVWREWEDPAWKYVYGANHKRLNLEALTEAQLETAALEAGAPLAELIPKGYKLRRTRRSCDNQDNNGMPPNAFFPRVDSITSVQAPPLTYVRMGGMVSLLSRFAIAFVAQDLDSEPETTANTIVDHEANDNQDTNRDIEEVVHPPTTGRTGIPFTRTMTMTTITDDETTMAESLEQEEKNAFRARLTVALTLFFIFWTAGSAIFMQTEKWAFGSAAYFCFISFTTVGYGDLAPKTPAGRSIFVVWAMLGVGTMTILVSILAEAYSTRYKSVIKTEVLKSTLTATGMDTARGYDSHTMLNTTTDTDTFRPSFSSPNGWSSPPIPSTTTTSRLARGPIQAMPPIPELQLKIGLNPQQRVSRERLHALPQQVLDHAEAVRSLLAAISVDDAPGNSQSDLARTDRTVEALMYEIERSLQDVANAAQEIVNTPDILKH